MFLPVSYVIEYRKGNTGKTRKQKITYGCGLGKTSTGRKWSYHLMVYLRLGWLTVLSSRNMVEQELYFLLTGPEWCWSGDTKVKVCLRHSIFVFLDQSKCAITTMEVLKYSLEVMELSMYSFVMAPNCQFTWAHEHICHIHHTVIRKMETQQHNGCWTLFWIFFFLPCSPKCVWTCKNKSETAITCEFNYFIAKDLLGGRNSEKNAPLSFVTILTWLM